MGFSYPKHTENFNSQNLNSRLTQVNFGLELELHEVFRSQTQSSLTLKGKTTQVTKKRKIKKEKKTTHPQTKLPSTTKEIHQTTAGLVETKELPPISPEKCFPFSLPSYDHLSTGDTAFQEWRSLFVSLLRCYSLVTR